MEFAQHMVDRGLARYEAGSWLLPGRLDEQDLPHTLAESLTRRLEALSADARDLAEALAIADGYALPLRSYRVLTNHGDQKRVFTALEALVSTRVLVADSERYRFSQRGFLAVLQTNLSPARRAALHAQFADLLAASGADVVQRAQHLLQGGREAEAVQLLCSIDMLARLPNLAVLEQAVQYAERQTSLSARALQRLRMAVLVKAALVGALDSFRRWLPPVLEQLERNSGLVLYRELAHVPADARLSQALAQQQQRYLSTPENEQVFAVGEAIRELARLTGATCSMAATTFALELLESLPSLEPLLPLSPALRVVAMLCQATDHWLRGRTRLAAQLYKQCLLRIAEPDRAGLDDMQHERTRLGVNYALALVEATLGIDAVEERAQILEQHRSMRVNAWRVRMLLQLNQGNPQGAQKCARRAELLQLQDESDDHHYLGTNAGFEIVACDLAGDLLGMKSALDALGKLADKQSGWRCGLLHAQSCYRALQGDFEGALELLHAGFEIALPGRDMMYGFLATQHIKVLSRLGRTEEALAHAKQYVAIIEREQLTAVERFVRLEAAHALLRAGQHEQAIQMLDPMIDMLESLGSSGLALGVFYDARARIAMAVGDRASFDLFATRCASEYRKGKNPVLNAKFMRLLEDAKQRDIVPAQTTLESAALLEAHATETEYSTVNSRIMECVDTADRARCALTLLLQSTDSYLGYLYGVERDTLQPLAGLPESAAESGLLEWLRVWVGAERALSASAAALLSVTISEHPPSHPEPYQSESGTVTGTESARARNGPAEYYTDCEGHRFRAALLVAEHAVDKTLAAVLVFEVQPGQYLRPPAAVMSEVASQLLHHHDVSGVPLLPVSSTLEE
jgi:hypothetical protein